MRSLNSKALALGIAAIAASGVSSSAGCSSTKPTEIVPGTLTQVQVPKDLAGIQVEVTANGKQAFCQGYQVAAGFVELPSTLGVIQGAPNTTVRITIRGYDTATSNDLLDCNNLQVNQANAGDQGPPPRVLRQAVLTYVDQHTLFLPMPLSYSCYDTDCSGQGSDSTCIAGACGSGDIAASTLAEFDPSLVDGTQQCFSPSACFSAQQPAVLVDAATCTYAVPPQLTGVGSGLNVRITYTDDTWTTDPGTGIISPQPGVPLEQEILNQDPNEGFFIPDSTQPQHFALAPGLCGLVHNATNPTTMPPPAGPATFHTISDIEVATGCPSKLPLLPFCASEQHGNVSSSATPPVVACGAAIPLEPTPSAVYMVMDDSGSMSGLGGVGGAFGKDGYTTAMNLSFAFPVFKHTYVAFRFLDHNNADCENPTTPYTSPTIDFGVASTVQPEIATQLLAPAVPDSVSNPAALDLMTAMRLDQGVYKHILDFSQKLGADSGSQGPLNVGGAMFFVNRIPTISGPSDAGTGGDAGGNPTEYPQTAADCNPHIGGTATAASCNGDPACEGLVAQATAAYQKGLSTYFVVINDQEFSPQAVLDFYKSVATGAGAGVTVLDATSTQPSVVLQNFQTTLASVATCLYDLPDGVDTTASLSVTVPPGTPVFNPSQFPVAISIAQSSSCNLANASTAQGWNVDNGRIRICGQACNNVQGVIGAVALAALSQGTDGGTDGGFPASADGGVPVVPDVPVDVTMPCGDAGSP
jgi:hypothetical protein